MHEKRPTNRGKLFRKFQKDKRLFGFDLKSTVTLMLTITTCFLAIVDKIQAEHFLPIVTMVFTYYFMRKEKNESEENDNGNSNSRQD